MKITRPFLAVILGLSAGAYGANSLFPAEAGNNQTTPIQQNSQEKKPANTPPLKPYPRLLPLDLIVPSTANAGVPIAGVKVSLKNPGEPAPNSRLRLIIHEVDHGNNKSAHALSPDNVKVEVFENGSWIPVLLSLVEGNVMGAIGSETMTMQSERYKRGGFEIPAGFNKTWQLRVTFSVPGTYSIVAAISPDNGSRHIAQPAYSTIDVQ